MERGEPKLLLLFLRGAILAVQPKGRAIPAEYYDDIEKQGSIFRDGGGVGRYGTIQLKTKKKEEPNICSANGGKC